MIVSRPFQDLMRGVGRGALDLPVAAFAAAAAAFVAFAMPGDLLAALVGATGLPAIVPAAEPPLGLTARIAIGATGAALTFGLVFYLLRVLDRSMLGGSRPRRAAPAEEAPRPRRRDFHPDAPAPRPISAAREFGEPAPPGRPSGPQPAWLAGAEAEPEPEPEAEPVPAEHPDAMPEPAAGPAALPASLAELMDRLEQGLARRRVRPAPQAPAPQVFPEAGDDRLQSAIDSLQRLAARQS